MASITDVAKRAGLSVASVSRVLNETGFVSEQTRQRVMRAAAALAYSIDRRARGLRRQKSGAIGLVVADAENPFFSKIIRAIEEVAYRSKHDLFLCNSNEDVERENFHLLSMHAQRIDGIILLPVGADATSLPAFLGRDIPLVCLDRRLPGADFDLTIVDNRAGAELAVRHFVEAGHRRIAIVTAHDRTVSFERIAGFHDALAAHGIEARAEYVRRGQDARLDSGYTETAALLDLRVPPTAVFVTNQLLALGALKAIRDKNRRVPGEVSLIGFDDAPYAGLLDPPLTTIAQPTNELGRRSAELLLDRVLRGYSGAARSIVLPPTLIARASVGPPPDRSRR
ncbi:MAG: LacI family DNA-binding transcriptional regulator [Candidatus Eremiobacteraeota bacterium]|nr:LacI family DNA-binding transcriptional regulator [Candidatus Eremiobacteraeota bacterium]